MTRVKIVLFFVAFFYFIILGRVYYLSIEKHNYYKKLALENIRKKIYLKPTRGIIYDSNHIPVAFNELKFTLSLKPHMKDNNLTETLNYIKEAIPTISIEKLKKRYKRKNSLYNHNYISILEYMDYNQSLPVIPMLSQNENIKIESDYLRIYPFKNVMSHIIGYVGKANSKEIKSSPKLKIIKITGKNGIEKSYNDYLMGSLGYRDVIADAKNRIIKELSVKEPISHNIVLNVDTRLQSFIYNLFKKSGKKGTIIVMKTTGEIVSMVNYPSYDDNLFVKGISVTEWKKLISNNFNPFLNKAIGGLYPPGSVVKPAIGLIAIASGKISAYKKLWCPGYIEIGNRKFRDWKPDGHGYTNLFKAIKRSADTYFYQIGLLLGIDYISEHLKRMGFGKKTGIDLPNERKGIVPNKNWKRKRYKQPWFIGETLNVSIGQGYMLVTPIQVAVNTALLATGKLVTPQIVKQIDDKKLKPILKDVLTPKEKKLLPLIRKGMWQVCNASGGTATKHIDIPYFKIAGKTGTAQVHSIPQDVKKRKREDELAYWKRSHAWLTTYGPYKNPQFIVTVMIEHGGHGGSAAGELVSKIYKKLVKLHYIKIDKEKR
jgi:penicillin-binding protein 2